MITSIFKKSTPINYSLMGILVVIFFFLYQFQTVTGAVTTKDLIIKFGVLVLVFSSIFLSKFIVKKNGLTKDSSYIILFYFLFFLFFPNIFNNIRLLLANFFILLAIRRLVSLQTLKASKEKIFDAALWIFVASLFQFWCVIFIILVYSSIIFHVSRDYRNWLVPIMALFTTAVIFIFYSLLLDNAAIANYLATEKMNFELDYFTNTYQNIAFSIYAVFVAFFFFPYIVSLTKKPLNLQSSYKKVIFAMLLGTIIFIISSNKNNDLLVFTILPMAIMATNTIEYSQNKIQQEIILTVSILCGLFCFFSQL